VYSLGSSSCPGTRILMDPSSLQWLSRTDAGVPAKDTPMSKSALVLPGIPRIFNA